MTEGAGDPYNAIAKANHGVSQKEHGIVVCECKNPQVRLPVRVERG